MVTSESQLTKSFSGLTINQKVDRRGVWCGACNVCSAPCSSCFPVDKVLMKSDDESTIEACADNIVVAEHRKHENGQMSDVSTVAGMVTTTSNSFTEDAIGNGSSKACESSASDANVLHSNHGIQEGHNDCLPCASGTDELTSAKDELEDSLIKHNRTCKFSGESPDKGSSPASKNDKEYDKPSDTKDKLVDSSTKHLNSVLDREAENGFVCSDPPLSATNSIRKNEDMDVEVPPADEADDLDMEQDVKVCDICGDAGREDLLAVCSRCSDGAEHTYCMQKMLDKVPEGEWLCEECKSMEEVENERQGKARKLDENEKVNNSAQASSEQGNSSDFERNGAKGEIKQTGKRCRDDTDSDVSSTAKKPATVQTIGSPKTKHLGKAVPSSTDNSLKNHDNGRLKSLHPSSSNASQVNDIPESTNPASDLQPHGFRRGSLSKSISFNSMASKRKVKLVDQAVLQRQKSAKEHASFRTKDGVTRSIGKSVSFKSTMSSRLESKSKMLSPRQSHIQDNRNIKERSSFERQSSFRSEQPLANSTMGTSKNATSRIDKLAASRGESSTPVALREKKLECVDGKSIALPRSSSFVARRSIESSSSLGEFKKPSVNSRSTVGVTYTNGFNKIGKKSSHTGPKEDISSCSVVGEQQHYNNNYDNILDVANSGERMREQLGPSRFLPPSMRSARDESRKPGVDRKHKVSNQADGSSVSTGGAEVVSDQDHISRSTGTKRSFSDVMNPVENILPVSSTVYTLKQETISDVKRSSLVNSKSSLSGGDGFRFPLLHSSKDALNNVSVAAPLFLNSAAIPEHEYIWQGSFEINRSDRSFELWDGIQAHLSTCASAKVVHAVDKFESRIVLYEVPRLSTWPTQFQENGVKEDHIALFFFAKDIESYNKNYKILVDKMMTNDLALRADVHGIELLIFPSSQLHDNMKRWNSLFYIWGVFRGKRENCSTDIPNSSNQSSATLHISPAIMSLPESRCSLVPIVSELPVSGDAVSLPGSHSEESHNLLLSRTVDDNHRTNISTLDESDSGLNCSSSAAIQNNSQERDISSSCEPHVLDMTSSRGCQMEKVPMDIPIDQHHPSQTAVANNVASDGVSGNGIVLDRVSNKEQSSIIIEDKDSSKDGETPKRRKLELKDLNMLPEEWVFDQVSLTNGETRNEPCGPLETMSHVPSVSMDYMENPERRFFPLEPKPVNATPWKIHPLEQDQIQDKSPNLELALWAENKTSTMEIGEKMSSVEDDVSSSLSLSLSFPLLNRSWFSKD